LQVKLGETFRFVAYGDARFHDPKNTEHANPAVRVALVQAVAAAHPAFIAFTGDIVYRGSDRQDWQIFESETAVWRENHIPVFPTIGNHEVLLLPKEGLRNYFEHFPDLKERRYYSVRAGNTILLALDSTENELGGAQGQWLTDKLDSIPSDVDFVFVMMHHPPYTSSSMNMHGEGHSARPQEQALAKLLEERQARTRARFIVVSGHVHNYERHEHGGVTYFVSGGAGAHAYAISRAPTDLYQSKEINYHYLLVEVNHQQLKITMNRLQIADGKQIWTQPDAVTINAPTAAVKAAGR
jgi:Icc-related predicted phosphoesterase